MLYNLLETHHVFIIVFFLQCTHAYLGFLFMVGWSIFICTLTLLRPRYVTWLSVVGQIDPTSVSVWLNYWKIRIQQIKIIWIIVEVFSHLIDMFFYKKVFYLHQLVFLSGFSFGENLLKLSIHQRWLVTDHLKNVVGKETGRDHPRWYLFAPSYVSKNVSWILAYNELRMYISFLTHLSEETRLEDILLQHIILESDSESFS